MMFTKSWLVILWSTTIWRCFLIKGGQNAYIVFTKKSIVLHVRDDIYTYMWMVTKSWLVVLGSTTIWRSFLINGGQNAYIVFTEKSQATIQMSVCIYAHYTLSTYHRKGYSVLLLLPRRLSCISLLIIALKFFPFNILVDCLLLGWYMVQSIKTPA